MLTLCVNRLAWRRRVTAVALRFEPARRALPAVMMPGDRGYAGSGAAGAAFRLEIDRIKVRAYNTLGCGIGLWYRI